MKNPNLPQEIMIEIFARLPPKSIGKCRCLSKRHRSLLSTPQFIETHSTATKTHQQQSLILITPSHSITTVKNDNVSTNLNLPNNCSAVIGSCDGLVLLLNDDGDLMLINPVTLQRFDVPNSPISLNRYESFSMHGFGYDSSSEDYKMVTLSYYNTDNGYETDCEDTFVDVYSLKTGVWKRVDCSPYDHSVPRLLNGSFVNGSIHWLSSSGVFDCPGIIVAFDLASEEFDEIPAPIGVERFMLNKLMVLGGCLCMLDDRVNAPPNIWVMKEYGVRESWSKLSVDGDYKWDIVKALYFIGDEDEEVVFVMEDERLVVYNMEDGSLRDMVVDGAPAMAIDGCTFIESLLCPVFDNTA